MLDCCTAAVRVDDGQVVAVVGTMADVTDAYTFPRTPRRSGSAHAGAAEGRRLRALEGITRSLSLGGDREALESRLVAGMTSLVEADMYALYLSEGYANTLTFAAPPYLSPRSRDTLAQLVQNTVAAFDQEGIVYEAVALTAHDTQVTHDEPDLEIESHLTDNDRTRIILQQVWRKEDIASKR